jgi:uncharacterized protein YbaR (Trm112 family)
MTLEASFLAKLRSPGGRHPLRLASVAELAALESARRGGTLRTRAGRLVEQALGVGLVCEAEGVVFRVDDEIPILLAEEAIPIPGSGAGPSSAAAH